MTRSAILALSLGAAVVAAPTAPARADAAAGLQAARDEAGKFHQKLLDEYMHSRWSDLEGSLKDWSKHNIYLTAAQRADVSYINQMFKEHRPSWWSQARSSTPVTFTATIWKKSFKANYMPSGMVGAQQVIGVDPQGNLLVVVSWQPHMVDSPKKARDEPAASHALTEGDLAEAIIWHELGHNYITRFLPAEHVKILYERYFMLFAALQEFYADATSLYHCSPQGRKALLFARAPGFLYAEETDPHYRGSYALSALLLSWVLEEPKSWPSFRLPGKVPPEDVERRTIYYMYTHLSPAYTLAEDRRLREQVGKFMWSNGADILRRKGTLTLPNRQTFKLMPGDDRDFAPKREQWIKEKLQAAIAAKLTDDPALAERQTATAQRFRIVYRPGMPPEIVPVDGPARPTSRPAPKPAPKPSPPVAVETKVEPTPAPPAQVEPKPEPKPAAESDDAKADKLLQLARTYLSNNLKAPARRKLQETIATYPRTHAARLAKDLLERLAEEDK